MEIYAENEVRRQILGANLEDAVSRFYSGERLSFNLGYVVERAAGVIEAAICEQGHSEQWVYVRIAVEPAARTRVIAFDVVECIAEIGATVPITQWWWLNKLDSVGSALRLRLQVPFLYAYRTELELSARLAARGLRVKVLRYEPELRLFGGPAGMKIAHEFFACDSEFLAQWARTGDSPHEPIIPPGLSLALMIYLARAGGLDLFEQWGLFDRVAHKRLVPTNRNPVNLAWKDVVARVIAAVPETLFSLYEGERLRLLSAYTARLKQCAERLSQAHYDGDLECGLRESLVPAILFHWNRICLPAGAQAALSRAAADEFGRLARKGTA